MRPKCILWKTVSPRNLARFSMVSQERSTSSLDWDEPPTTCHMSQVACHVSHVTCHMSQVTYHKSYFFFFTKWWSLSVEGLLSMGPSPSSFYSYIDYLQCFLIPKYLFGKVFPKTALSIFHELTRIKVVLTKRLQKLCQKYIIYKMLVCEFCQNWVFDNCHS